MFNLEDMHSLPMPYVLTDDVIKYWCSVGQAETLSSHNHTGVHTHTHVHGYLVTSVIVMPRNLAMI